VVPTSRSLLLSGGIEMSDPLKGLRLLDVSSEKGEESKDSPVARFLYADPTPNALQVFLRRPGLTVQPDQSGLPAEHGAEEGVWINADPIPGCVVCNIGESGLFHISV